MPPNCSLVYGVGSKDMTEMNGSFSTGFRMDGNENGNLYFFIFGLLLFTPYIFCISAHEHPDPGADWIGYHGESEKDNIKVRTYLLWRLCNSPRDDDRERHKRRHHWEEAQNNEQFRA